MAEVRTCALETLELTKTFGHFVAVDKVSFSVQRGEIFGFLGPNGAGKTTTMRMLLSLLAPTAGSARVLGYDIVREVRHILASAPGVRVVDDPAKGVYPTPQDATGIDDVLVGRIREDTSHKGSVNLWLVCDNVRKGAATNAVQIAEKICQ